MCTKESVAKWISVPSCPCTDIIIPTGVDQNNYIVIDEKVWSSGINCIYKYNIDTNKWNKISGLNNIRNVSYFSAALDVKKQILYLIHSDSVRQIQLNNNNINNINNYTHSTTFNIPEMTKSIILNDSLFVIGGHENNSILKWSSENKTFTKFSDMYNKIKMGGFALIYNHKNNCLLLFRGFDYDNYVRIDYILEFNMNTKQWNKLQVSLPKKMSSVCCTMAINNKYILLFGGLDNNRHYCDDIYIYSLKYKTIKKSKVRCPSKGKFVAITVNNNIKDEKLVFGYMRNEWRICDIYDHYFPPNYLIKLIHSYYLNEFVYLLDINDKKHYKINTLHIV